MDRHWPDSLTVPRPGRHGPCARRVVPRSATEPTDRLSTTQLASHVVLNRARAQPGICRVEPCTHLNATIYYSQQASDTCTKREFSFTKAER